MWDQRSEPVQKVAGHRCCMNIAIVTLLPLRLSGMTDLEASFHVEEDELVFIGLCLDPTLPSRNVFQVGDFMQPRWARLRFGQSCRGCLHRRSMRISGASACGDSTYDSNYACKNDVFMQMETCKHACRRRTTVSPQSLPLFFLTFAHLCSEDF